MTGELELEERLALAAEGAPEQVGVSFAELRRRGDRRRHVRTGVVSAAALLAVGGVTVAALPTGPGAGNATATQAGSDLRGAPVQPTVIPTGRTDPSAYPNLLARPDFVDTGEKVTDGAFTIWFGGDEKEVTQFVGVRRADGTLSVYAVSHQPWAQWAPSAPPGFRSTFQVGIDGDVFLVGSVLGKATRVTLTVDGVARTAKVAVWPQNSQLHMWWLRLPGDTGRTLEVRDLVAADSSGRTVASGR